MNNPLAAAHFLCVLTEVVSTLSLVGMWFAFIKELREES